MKNARPRRRLKGPIIREYAFRLQRQSIDLRVKSQIERS